jgi:hypothetical protein
MHNVAQVFRIANLPIGLVCFPDATIMFAKERKEFCILDNPEKGVKACINDSQIQLYNDTREGLETVEYETKYAYKTMPLLLSWLTQQNLM